MRFNVLKVKIQHKKGRLNAFFKNVCLIGYCQSTRKICSILSITRWSDSILANGQIHCNSILCKL